MADWLTPASRKAGKRREPSWTRPGEVQKPAEDELHGTPVDDWTVPPRTRSRSRQKASRRVCRAGASSGSVACPAKDLDWLTPAGAASSVASADRIASLRVSALAVACNQRSAENTAAYASNGKDRNRIRQVLSGATPCCDGTCKQGCRLKFHESEVAQVCDLYWSLPSEEQALLIAIMKDEACGVVGEVGDVGVALRKLERTHWCFGGKLVCFNAWCKLLGSSKRTILKMVHGDGDERHSPNSPALNACVNSDARACLNKLYKLQLYAYAATPKGSK